VPKPLRPSPVSGCISVLRLRLLLAFLSMLAVNGFYNAAVGQSRPADMPAQSDFNAVKQSPAAEEAQSQPSAPVPSDQPQGRIHIVPFGRNSGVIKPQFGAPGAHLTYFGGPVISNIQVVVVFWGTNVAPAITANGTIDQFFTDITSSRYFDLLTEYTTAGITGANGTSTSNQTIGHGTFGGKFTITPSICPGSAACTVTNTQIQTELAAQINSHVLPAPQTDIHGIINTYYAIYFPPNVTISLDPTTRSCVSGGFCAYHSNTGSLVPYGVMPDFSTGGCSLGCGSGTTLQIATAVSSHEMAEALTDPEVGSASVFGPPLGWYDGPTPNLGEIADLCDPINVTVNAGSSTYTVEMLFSNVQNMCVSGPPVFSMPSPAGGAGPSVPFSMTLTIRYNDPSIITPVNYLGTVHFTSSDPGAVLPADYTFVAGDAGVHTFPFTLSILGNQTITVTDTRSSGFTGTTTVNVNTVSDLALTMQHAGNFGRTQTGSYTITAVNGGGGPTSGTVTVTDTLPTGLTAAAMSGTGWSCNVNTVTCTRADVLVAGGSYPPITLTVNVSDLISSMVTNIATISGGGETDTANDLVGDVTNIVTAGVDVSVTSTPFQLFTSQGATGVTLNTSIFNFGSAATTGAVTETITLIPGLTATALSGSGWNCTLATLTCTRSDSLASAQAYPAVTVTFNVALNAPLSVGSITATVSATGDTEPRNNTANVTTEIGPVLAIASGGATVTVNAGQPAQYVFGMAVTAAAGTVTFSCNGLPTAALCSFNPTSLNATSGNVTMTITTTARSSVVAAPVSENRRPWLWLGLLSLTLMAGLSLKLRTTPIRLRRPAPILGASALLIAGILAGCGGGSSSGTTTVVTTTGNGTPAGTYAITFTATSPVGTATRTVNLVVR
jgi:hypothetical protein